MENMVKKVYTKFILVIMPVGVAAGNGLIGDFAEYYYMTLVEVFFLAGLA